MALIEELQAVLGEAHVLSGAAVEPYRTDWTRVYPSNPGLVVKPGSTAEVADVLKIAAFHGIPVVPSAGRTGITGAIQTEGGIQLSVERMNRIREIRTEARIAVVEAGVILQHLHEAADQRGLYFPLWFGARGSAMIGGVLSTNAGGSNVLRYGSTRALCLGLEVVLPDGRVLNLMSQLHKDNSGYDLKQMFIGAEGTLGVITAAVMKLVPKPRAHATAWLSARSLEDALVLLNRLQAATGGAVEAFEYMPEAYMRRLAEARPDIRQPFSPPAQVNILVEVGATAPRDAVPDAEGNLPVVTLLEATLAEMMADGAVLDAELARTEAQRLAMWKRRELAAEVMFDRQPSIDTDIAVPLDRVPEFFRRFDRRLPALDPAGETICVCHLGDGNIHFTVYPSRADHALHDAVVEAVEDVVADLGGSFSAEHGVGLMKKPSMARRKDAVAIDVMRAVKRALDPEGLMNPGKVIPD
jgi:FAD/FMN-containing dehydrogenase